MGAHEDENERRLALATIEALEAVRRVVDRDLEAIRGGLDDPAYLTTVLAGCEGFRLARETAAGRDVLGTEELV